MNNVADNAVNRVQKLLGNALQKASTQLEGVTEGANRQRLSPKEQVERFFAMTDADLETLRQKKGEGEFGRYVQAMTKLARRY